MFLRSNVSRSGLIYEAKPLHGVYAGAFQDDRCVGAVAHYWNGSLAVQAPEDVEALARACVKNSGRRVTAIHGPLDQVRRARTALGFAEILALMDSDEALYALDLTDLVVPGLLVDGSVTCRPPWPRERDQICMWRIAYDVETLGGSYTLEAREDAEHWLDRLIADGCVWVALAGNELVSLSAFNAALPDMVQLGGIYTPPPHRGKGYAKAAVAASLLVARERGVRRAVLFTSNPSAARSYEAVGFHRVGDFGLVCF
jgi:GNAT superfamily N-acetyltransferase